jgi:hypothetical protein
MVKVVELDRSRFMQLLVARKNSTHEGDHDRNGDQHHYQREYPDQKEAEQQRLSVRPPSCVRRIGS